MTSCPIASLGSPEFTLFRQGSDSELVIAAGKPTQRAASEVADW